MILLGMEAKAYLLTTGTRASWGDEDENGMHVGAAPSNLAEAENITDVTVSLKKGEADVTTRKASGFKLSRGTLKEVEVKFDIDWDPSDTLFDAIFKAWISTSESVAMAFLDQAVTVTGARGVWADWSVIGFEKKEPLENAQAASVTLKPTNSDVPPEIVKVQ